MIDLTPLDVRKKRGDFAKTLRGYDASEVDNFLELVAERMEVLVKEKLELEERSDTLGKKVEAQEGRENAIQEALVTAQKLREDVKSQAQQEAEFLLREARGRIEGMVNAAGRTLVERRAMLEELERQRERFQALGILQYEHETTSDVDHDIEIERRVRAGEIEAPLH